MTEFETAGYSDEVVTFYNQKVEDPSACTHVWTNRASPRFMRAVNLCQEGRDWPNSFSLAGEREREEGDTEREDWMDESYTDEKQTER